MRRRVVAATVLRAALRGASRGGDRIPAPKAPAYSLSAPPERSARNGLAKPPLYGLGRSRYATWGREPRERNFDP